MVRCLQEISDLAGLEGPVNLAVGIFDGVHRGHAAVIGAASERAGTAVVMTFEPHPANVLTTKESPGRITSLEHKQHLLAGLGVEFLIVVEFNEHRASQQAEAFVYEVAGACQLGCIAVGEDFRFGKDRQGDIALLGGIGSDLGFEVAGIDPVCDSSGGIISSTRVRGALGAGDIARVADLLGRDYSLFGVVKKGRRLGHELGFPTANISLGEGQFLPNGVYAVKVELEGESIEGVANLGTRPTFEAEESMPMLEVHLFDFQRDIYGQRMEVFFTSHIRDERAFDSIDALREQIGRDVEAAKSIA